MTARADVIIVGGGITGLSLAVELARLGKREIVVLEKRFTGAGGSGRNVGRIRAMQLTEELARFAIAAQAKHASLADELGANTLFWRAGYGWVLYEEMEMARMAEVRDMLRGLGLKPELIGAAETLRRLPVLDGGERPAGALMHRDAIVHHDAVLYAYRAAARRLGVRLLEDCEALEVLTSGSAVAGIRTSTGEIRGTTIVNAAGGWSGEFSAKAGIKIPNTPLRREALVTEAAQPFMQAAITFYRPQEGWFNQTLRGELVAGCLAPAEEPGVNLAATARSLGRTSRTILAKAPRLGHLRVVRQWAGVYDMTPDRKPLVGPVKRLAGFVQANGCNGRGFLLGPADRRASRPLARQRRTPGAAGGLRCRPLRGPRGSEGRGRRLLCRLCGRRKASMNIAERPFATKSEWVYEQLRRRILAGGYKPDDRLRLTELAREFEMSEMPVREALRMLQRDGLIEMHSHRGASVANLSWARAADIVAVRMHLEVMAVREAAKGHDKASLAELRKILDRMDRDLAAGAAARFSAGNREFHRLLYAPGGNAVLKQEIEELWDRVWRARAQSIFEVDRPRMAAAQIEHRAILAALAKGDPEAAVKAAGRHRDDTLKSWAEIVRRSETVLPES